MVVSEERAHGPNGVGIGCRVLGCQDRTTRGVFCWYWTQVEVASGVSDTGQEVFPFVGGYIDLFEAKVYLATSLTKFWDRNEGQ